MDFGLGPNPTDSMLRSDEGVLAGEAVLLPFYHKAGRMSRSRDSEVAPSPGE